jgi:hypothetical protein
MSFIEGPQYYIPTAKMHEIITMIRIFTSLLVGTLLISGCESQPVADTSPDEVLYFETLGNGSVRDTLEVILKDESSLQEMLAKIRPLGPIPEVDFTQVMVGLIAVPTESGGYVVEVKSIEKTGDHITVNYEFATPGQDCLTLQALSLPFQLVIIKRSEGQITFVRTSKPYSCAL